jgi:hypothetical protein
MNEQRGNLYLLTGFILGLAAGLLFAWVISPVKYVDTAPASLAPGVKDQYRQVIALAYQADHDLVRARQRIDLVDPGSSAHFLAAQAQRMLAENTSSQEASALAELAAAMNNALPAATGASTPTQERASSAQTAQAQVLAAAGSIATETPVEVVAIQTPTPRPSPTPAPTFTPRPTATPQLALDAPFVMKQKTEICDSAARPGLLQILVTGADGEPLPGVQIVITSKEGQDTFYTGLYPEISPGYADFAMTAGETYTLKVGEVSEIEQGIAIPSCGGGWQMEFEEGKQ